MHFRIITLLSNYSVEYMNNRQPNVFLFRRLNYNTANRREKTANALAKHSKWKLHAEVSEEEENERE